MFHAFGEVRSRSSDRAQSTPRVDQFSPGSPQAPHGAFGRRGRPRGLRRPTGVSGTEWEKNFETPVPKRPRRAGHPLGTISKIGTPCSGFMCYGANIRRGTMNVTTRHSVLGATASLLMSFTAILGHFSPASADDQLPFQGRANETVISFDLTPDGFLVTAIGEGQATYLGQFTRLATVLVHFDGTV